MRVISTVRLIGTVMVSLVTFVGVSNLVDDFVVCEEVRESE